MKNQKLNKKTIKKKEVLKRLNIKNNNELKIKITIIQLQEMLNLES